MLNVRFALVAASLATLVGCTQATEDTVDMNSEPIVGGEEAQPGAWPGTVALYFGSGQGCAGTLLHESWVLTAGHCIVRPSAANGGIGKVVIARHRLSSTEGETRTVDRAYRHQGFNNDNLNNDLALLHLSTPSTAPTARLMSSADAASLVAGADVTVVGWGLTRESGRPSDVLRQVTVPIIDNQKCKTYSQYDIVSDNMICAGLPQGAKDSCQGDSGGPLFMNINGKNTHVGLVSWGIGCARPNAPGVYTRIGNYLGWLHEKTNGAVGEAASTADGT